MASRTKRRSKYMIQKPNRIPHFKPVAFIKRGSTSTRSVLNYLKMKRGVPATAKEVKDVFYPFFKGPHDAARTLRTLERRGFAETVYPGAWRITPQGIGAVGLLAQRDKRWCAEEDEEDSIRT